MQELVVFNNEQFGEIRTIENESGVWFVATDVCKALEISNPSAAVDRLDEDERSKFNLGRQGMTNVVNEYGLYGLVLGSRKKEAQEFKRWIKHDVLPSIRKTGGYQQKPMTQLEIIAAQAQALVDHERRMNAIEETTKALDEKIDAAADAFMAPSFSVETWRAETKASISAIVETEKLSYGIYTGELYKKLENVAGCNLADRQTRMRNRMRKEGATASQCSAITKLYIISLDQKLRAIFDHIMVQEKASRLMKWGYANG